MGKTIMVKDIYGAYQVKQIGLFCFASETNRGNFQLEWTDGDHFIVNPIEYARQGQPRYHLRPPVQYA